MEVMMVSWIICGSEQGKVYLHQLPAARRLVLYVGQ
jgi:hypothetical protein